MKTTVPIMLKVKWIKEARLAFLPAPMEERIAVMQVPMFCPMMRGMAEEKVIAPVVDRACKIPVMAEDDWRMAVKSAPTATPNKGLVNTWKALWKLGSLCRGRTDADMASIPYIKTAKPSKALPIAFFPTVFPLKMSMTPIMARTGVKVDGFNIWMKKLSPDMPDKLSIQPVTVVPMLAPMMMGIACFSFITPELTRATTMTVVADEDWITAVTTVPKSRAFSLVELSFSNSCSILPPEIVVKLSPRICIPNKNRAKPPISSKIL